MNASEASHDPAEATVKAILGWLALAHGNTGTADIEALTQHLLTLRQTPLPPAQSAKLLDLLYAQADKVVTAELASLTHIALPVSLKGRHLVDSLRSVHEILAQS